MNRVAWSLSVSAQFGVVGFASFGLAVSKALSAQMVFSFLGVGSSKLASAMCVSTVF